MDLPTLLLFIPACFALNMAPGPNNLLSINNAAHHGYKAACLAGFGRLVAFSGMIALAAMGLAAVLFASEWLFLAIKTVGALYLLWLAWQALTAPTGESAAPRPLGSIRKIFVRATLNSLLNPKGLLFFMVFLPQFVTVGNASVTVQLVVLGVLLTLISLVFHSVLALCAGTLRGRLNSMPRRWANYGFASVMTALAARLLFLERPI